MSGVQEGPGSPEEGDPPPEPEAEHAVVVATLLWACGRCQWLEVSVVGGVSGWKCQWLVVSVVVSVSGC